MAHEIESMMSVREIPWHKLGVVLQDPPTVEEALRLSGLDGEVGLTQLTRPDTGDLVPAFATVRKSDGKTLGVVGQRYRPLQNREAFAWFQPFLSAGQAALETAGSLRGGRRVRALARLNRDPLVIAPGDEVVKYLLLSHGHDGTLAIRVGFTPVRVVCANTLAMAHGSDASKLLRLKYTKGTVAALDQIREVIDTADAAFVATAEQYRALVRTLVINQADLCRYVKQVFGLAEKDDDLTAQGRRLLESVAGLFGCGKGNDLVAVRGTAWAAYNAVTEYLTYQRGRSVEGRLDNLWFGSSADLSSRALELALAMAV